MSIKITWDQRSLKDLAENLKRFPDIFQNFLMDAGKLSADALRSNTPVRTGTMLSSIVIDVGPQSVRVYPTVPYTPFVEFGTSPHIIRPVNASALHFFIGGEEVFAKEVMHPGFPGRFFIKRTRDEIKDEVVDLAKMYVLDLFGK